MKGRRSKHKVHQGGGGGVAQGETCTAPTNLRDAKNASLRRQFEDVSSPHGLELAVAGWPPRRVPWRGAYAPQMLDQEWFQQTCFRREFVPIKHSFFKVSGREWKNNAKLNQVPSKFPPGLGENEAKFFYDVEFRYDIL